MVAGNPFDPSTALALNQARLAMLPPTIDDVLRYNPRMDVESARAYVNREAGRLADQRQRASIARYGSTTAINTGSAALEAEKAAQRAGFRFPFSNAANLARGAAGGALALTAFPVGTAIGAAGLSFFGIDGKDAVCTAGAGGVGALIGVSDCEGYLQLKAEQANADVAGTGGSLVAGPVSGPTTDLYGSTWGSFSVTGFVVSPNQPSTGYIMGKFTGSTPVPASNGRVPVMFGATSSTGSKYVFSRDFDQVVPANNAGPYPGVGPAGTWYAGVNVADWETVKGLCQTQTETCGNGDLAGLQAPSADPLRHLSCKILDSNGQDQEKSTGSFRESGGKIPDPVCPLLADGVTPKRVTVYSVNESTGERTVIYDGEQSPWAAEVEAKYPQCTTGLCTLELLRMPARTSCFEGENNCDGWYTDPQKETKYSCEYDGTVVSLDHCNQYRQVFDDEARNSGAPYSNQDGSFSLTPTTKNAAGSSLAGKPTFESCMEDSSATDVFSLVFTPVRCALVWAFVPSPLAITKQAADSADAVMDTDVGRWLLAVPSFFANLSVPGCKGFAWKLVPPLAKTERTVYPVDACTGWQADVAGVVYVCSTLFVLLAGAAAVLSQVSSVFGFAGFGRGSGGDGVG